MQIGKFVCMYYECMNLIIRSGMWLLIINLIQKYISRTRLTASKLKEALEDGGNTESIHETESNLKKYQMEESAFLNYLIKVIINNSWKH